VDEGVEEREEAKGRACIVMIPEQLKTLPITFFSKDSGRVSHESELVLFWLPDTQG
jgi:hypothetical protein